MFVQLQLQFTLDWRRLQHEGEKKIKYIHNNFLKCVNLSLMDVVVTHIKEKKEKKERINIKKHIEQSVSYVLTWQSRCHDISLPEPILSLPHNFFNQFLMIQIELCCRSFLWADAARIPLCIAIPSLLPAGLSGTDGIVKKQIWAESGRTSLCQSMRSYQMGAWR